MAILKDLLGSTTGELLDNLTEVGDTYIDLEKIIPVVNEMLTDQASEMRKLNRELGSGSKTTAELRSDFASLSRQLGVTTRDIYELVNETRQYHQGIKESTSSTLQFVKASGASIDIIGKFSAKLNILGKTSKSSFDTMYTNILSVREAYGLTDNQIDDIIVSLGNYATVTGASSEQMERASITLAKFTSQLTSAGIEADKVSEIINGMLDPDRMTDNLVLMSKIGVSITDMVSGNPIEKLEGSADKLKQIGQEISNIAKTNRIQANEVAKVYGLTLEQANLLANMDTSENALNTQKQLEQYRNEMTTFVESIKYTVTRLSGLISGPLAYIGKIFETFGNVIGMLPRGIGALIVGVTGKRILNKISEHLGDAAKKWGKNIAEPLKEYMSQVDKKSKSKKSDMDALSPKLARDATNLGFGYNFAYKQETKLNEKLAKKRGAKKSSELDIGEVIENYQQYQNFYNEIQKEIERAGGAGTIKGRALNKKYAGMSTALERVGGIIENQGGKYGYKKFTEEDEYTQNIKAYQRASKKEEKEAASITLIDDFLTKQEVNTGFLKDMNSEAIQQMAEVLSIGDYSSPIEALKALEEFLGNSNLKAAKEGVKGVTQKIDDLGDEAKQDTKFIEDASESLKELGKSAQGAKLGLGNRMLTLLEGVGPFIRNNLKKVIGAGIGGLGIGILSAIGKNEKIQESLSGVKESISGVFSTLVESISPAIEAVSNWINAAINWLKPKIDAVAEFMGKIASWFGGKVSKSVESIEKSVSAIEDTYKQEDLKTMVGGAAVFNSETNELLAKLDDIYYKVVDVTKKQDVAAEAAVAGYISGGAK